MTYEKINVPKGWKKAGKYGLHDAYKTPKGYFSWQNYSNVVEVNPLKKDENGEFWFDEKRKSQVKIINKREL